MSARIAQIHITRTVNLTSGPAANMGTSSTVEHSTRQRKPTWTMRW